MFKKYGLRKNKLLMSKIKVLNINVMTIALKLIVSYEYLSLKENFHDTCFGHVFSNAYEYGIAKEKIDNNLKYVFIKSTQSYL